VLSNSIKQKRKEKAGKWSVPIPKVKPVAEDEVFKVMRSGKRKKKQWKRMVNKVSFVGESFTRKPPKCVPPGGAARADRHRAARTGPTRRALRAGSSASCGPRRCASRRRT